jgi:predicted RND superfamily exporter protein
MAFFANHFGGDVIENIYLTGKPGSFHSPARLERLLELERELEALPEVGRAISIADWVREMNSALGEQGRIPKSDDGVAQLLLPRSSGQPGALSVCVRMTLRQPSDCDCPGSILERESAEEGR